MRWEASSKVARFCPSPSRRDPRRRSPGAFAALTRFETFAAKMPSISGEIAGGRGTERQGCAAMKGVLGEGFGCV